jgi:hypothetical protein
VAISMAVIAGLRATAGRMPSPTRSRSVTARAAAARLTPAVKKQSSMTHSWWAPLRSRRRATSRTRAGGNVRSKHIPISARGTSTRGTLGAQPAAAAASRAAAMRATSSSVQT